MSAGDASQHILEVGEGLDVVELRSADEVAHRCPACGAAVGSGEQVVLAAERDGANGTLDGVGVEFNARVLEQWMSLQNVGFASRGALRVIH